MDPRQLQIAASEVLSAYKLKQPPFDPIAIAGEEGIALLPGSYDGCFDGRIEYRKSGSGGGMFFLLYAEEQPVIRPITRVRFSIAHELAHYYLPHHREYLLSGYRHGSKACFISEVPMEREADLFAVNLLMPEDCFREHVGRKAGGVCSMQNLAQLSESIFRTSLISTVIRYVQLSFEPCCVVVSRDQQVSYSISSEDMRLSGLGWVTKNSRVPAASVTAKALAAAASGRKPEYGASVTSDVWFQSRRVQRLWEECKVLGDTGLVLTFIVIEPDESDEQEESEE